MRPFQSLFTGWLLIAAGHTAAAPVYYTFEGALDWAVAPGYSIGQQVSYTFMVDVAQDPYNTYWDFEGQTPYTIVHPDQNLPGFTADHFLVDYVGGDAFASDGAIPYFSGQDLHTGSYMNNGGSITSTLGASNLDTRGWDHIVMMDWTHGFPNWAVGQSGFMLDNLQFDMETTRAVGSYNMTLTAISDVNPFAPPPVDVPAPGAVPEPSTFVLAGLGLLALGAARRRRIRA